MLESILVSNVGAARKETTDISAAVSDGVDAFILSHETSVSSSGLEATKLLAKAIGEAENCFDYEVVHQQIRDASIEEGKRASVTDILCTTAS